MKQLIHFNLSILTNIQNIMSLLDNYRWNKNIISINNETIGRHCRHIIEFYLTFFDGLNNNLINYDSRLRNHQIENDIDYAQKKLNEIKLSLDNIENNYSISIILNDTIAESKLDSSVERELMYIADHAIHHGHIIQIAIQNEFNDLEISDLFYSPSTLESMKCVQ